LSSKFISLNKDVINREELINNLKSRLELQLDIAEGKIDTDSYILKFFQATYKKAQEYFAHVEDRRSLEKYVSENLLDGESVKFKLNKNRFYVVSKQSPRMGIIDEDKKVSKQSPRMGIIDKDKTDEKKKAPAGMIYNLQLNLESGVKSIQRKMTSLKDRHRNYKDLMHKIGIFHNIPELDFNTMQNCIKELENVMSSDFDGFSLYSLTKTEKYIDMVHKLSDKHHLENSRIVNNMKSRYDIQLKSDLERLKEEKKAAQKLIDDKIKEEQKRLKKIEEDRLYKIEKERLYNEEAQRLMREDLARRQKEIDDKIQKEIDDEIAAKRKIEEEAEEKRLRTQERLIESRKRIAQRKAEKDEIIETEESKALQIKIKAIKKENRAAKSKVEKFYQKKIDKIDATCRKEEKKIYKESPDIEKKLKRDLESSINKLSSLKSIKANVKRRNENMVKTFNEDSALRKEYWKGGALLSHLSESEFDEVEETKRENLKLEVYPIEEILRLGDEVSLQNEIEQKEFNLAQHEIQTDRRLLDLDEESDRQKNILETEMKIELEKLTQDLIEALTKIN
jgi:hypothetical protein